MKEITEVKGKQFGVRIGDRSDSDSHQMIELLTEDDENWFVTTKFSAYWLDDMIQQLQAAKDHLERTTHKGKWGYYRKKSDVK